MSRFNEMVAALERLDLKWAERNSPFKGASEETLLCALHKARYEVATIDIALRRESREWLQAHGYTRLKQQAWPDQDLLET